MANIQSLPTNQDQNKYPKEVFEQAVIDAEPLIVDAIKFFSMKVPPLVPYFSLIQLRALNKPNLTMRLNLKSTGGNAILEYNPMWMTRLNQQCVLAFLFYGETLRIALHHCTTRLHQPVTINLLSSNLIVYEVQELLQKWVALYRNWNRKSCVQCSALLNPNGSIFAATS